MNHLGDYDVIVIGAGHAGIEAAHAAATLGARTAVFTMSLDAIGNMPCNPSIGGTAKGTLVRELDALGGVMGLAADATYLQSRMLNKGKGPAVHALRVQTDRKRYHEYMKHALELTPGLAIHQAEIISIEVEDGHVKGVVTQLNGEYGAKCVVIATGTNLGGKIFVGDAWYASGPDGIRRSLSEIRTGPEASSLAFVITIWHNFMLKMGAATNSGRNTCWSWTESIHRLPHGSPDAWTSTNVTFPLCASRQNGP